MNIQNVHELVPIFDGRSKPLRIDLALWHHALRLATFSGFSCFPDREVLRQTVRHLVPALKRGLERIDHHANKDVAIFAYFAENPTAREQLEILICWLESDGRCGFTLERRCPRLT